MCGRGQSACRRELTVLAPRGVALEARGGGVPGGLGRTSIRRGIAFGVGFVASGTHEDRRQPARWTTGPAITGSMDHWAGYSRLVGPLSRLGVLRSCSPRPRKG